MKLTHKISTPCTYTSDGSFHTHSYFTSSNNDIRYNSSMVAWHAEKLSYSNWTHTRKLDLSDGALYTEHNDFIFVALSEIVNDDRRHFFHSPSYHSTNCNWPSNSYKYISFDHNTQVYSISCLKFQWGTYIWWSLRKVNQHWFTKILYPRA